MDRVFRDLVCLPGTSAYSRRTVETAGWLLLVCSSAGRCSKKHVSLLGTISATLALCTEDFCIFCCAEDPCTAKQVMPGRLSIWGYLHPLWLPTTVILLSNLGYASCWILSCLPENIARPHLAFYSKTCRIWKPRGPESKKTCFFLVCWGVTSLLSLNKTRQSSQELGSKGCRRELFMRLNIITGRSLLLGISLLFGLAEDNTLKLSEGLLLCFFVVVVFIVFPGPVMVFFLFVFPGPIVF